SDIYGVLHLYSGGVRAKSIDFFNKVVRPFVPRMRYLVTEFNIRLSLKDNPHLTNQYAMEFARKLADVMSRPEIEAMYTHSVPEHSVLYWSNGRKYATVVGGHDDKLTGDAMSRGWHLTPTGRVYELYSRLAWNGELIAYRGGDKQSYWAVRQSDGRVVVTLINDSGKAVKKKVKIAGREMSLNAPPRSIVCFDGAGNQLESLLLTY
ncbi:MAG TPA: glycoside hydrolase family 30 beta sandwich domain-containing protein, partial [Blastocatellia bacterium]|nr:glycoside hydrolase family 30 beta sandwich domain-containing protein [Blastocatellia bacterium]